MHANIAVGLTVAPAPQPAALMKPDAELELVHDDFESLYRREYPAMIAVATVLSGQDAEDLVHDAMVKAFVNWGTVRRLERPGGWCHRVLVNLCHSWWRRGQTRARWVQRQARHEPTTPEPSAETVDFWDAVRRLPERPRAVVTLYYAGDHPVAEIARILDTPEGTVRSDLSRARAALARDLGL